MDDIEKRLRDVSDSCVKAYLVWVGNKRNPETRESLQDTIHELRKVSARLEIEIAVSEREEMASRPIPIPPHRATRKGGQHHDDGDDDAGNRSAPEPQPDRGSAVRQGMRRRPYSGPQGGRGHTEE